MKKSMVAAFFLTSLMAAGIATEALAGEIDLVDGQDANMESVNVEFTVQSEAFGAPFEALWNSITFNNGVPVGGSASVKMWPDGNFQFAGHLHDSGAPSYNDTVLFAVTGRNGYVLAFSHRGHMAGTFEPGSRDDDWNNSGHNQYIATHWNEFVGAGWTARANTSFDVAALWGSIKSAIGYIKDVVVVVGTLG